jgi:hypothetical protein
MNIIKATYNVVDKTWAIVDNDLEPGDTELHFSFVSDEEMTKFNGLAFGFQLVRNDLAIQTGRYPSAGVRYEQADSTPLVAVRLNVVAAADFKLEVWVQHGDDQVDGEFEFTTPNSQPPFPSWNWADDKWNPPIPRPDELKPWAWNEETQGWDPLPTE